MGNAHVRSRIPRQGQGALLAHLLNFIDRSLFFAEKAIVFPIIAKYMRHVHKTNLCDWLGKRQRQKLFLRVHRALLRRRFLCW